MGPLSRFEKIEAERPPREPPDHQEPGRFLATEAPGPLPDPSLPPTRLEAAEPGPRTADGELDRLPTLACAVCAEESSKFASHCRACGSSLHSDQARALNLERLARFDAEAAAQRAQEAARRDLPGPAEQPLDTFTPGRVSGPLDVTRWPPWAVGLAVTLALGLLFPKLLLLALPGLGLWLGWYLLRRPSR